MLNKNDPLIGVVQEVMKKNQAERDAAKLVNEKFGITDRKALPHEKQGEWDAAYKSVLTEGVESLDEASLAALAPPRNKVTHKDVLVGRGVLKKHPTQPGKHILAKEDMSPNPTSAPSSQPSATSIRKAATKVKVRMGGNPTSQPNSNRPANAYRKAATSAIARMGRNPTNAPISSPSQSGSRPMEEGSDVTSPSGMGIKKPDYAPAGTTPDYAKSKEQTVNRAAKTSLPPGTVKEETLEEKAVSKAQHRFFGLVRGIQKGKAHGSAKAEKAASSMSAKSVKDYAKTKEKGLPEKVTEALDAADRGQIKGQTQLGKKPQVSYGNIPALTKAKELANSGSGVGTAMSGFTPPSASAAKPSTQATAPRPAPVVKTRPDVPVGSLPAAKPAARTNAGITKLNADSAARQQAAKIGDQTGGVNTAANGPKHGMGWEPSKPADRPNDLGKAGVPGTGGKLAPTPATAPKPKPAGGSTAKAKPVAKPAASKVVPVKKAAPTAKKQKGTPASRLQSRNQRDSAVVGPGGRIG